MCIDVYVSLVDKRHIVMRTFAGTEISATNLHFSSEEDAKFEFNSYHDKMEKDKSVLVKPAAENMYRIRY